MIAAKQFDPVLGVDIHIIQPPGPVPPVPIPHPFVGMVMDPFDFIPVIGGTVHVNGIPRATAGSAGIAAPPHIPIGGVFVKPPGNECEVFMGSATVLADGEPLSRLGMPALSCHDIGMPSPPRVKKKSKAKSLFLPTSVVLSIPAGPPVLVGGPPTISMMAIGTRLGMAALGKGFRKLRKLQKSGRRMKALSKKAHAVARKAMDRLGVPPSVRNRVHRSLCTVTGHPVDVATGKVFTEAVDFELPGPIPFRWERVWYSTSVYEGTLGHGWHHAYDLALLEEDGAVAVRLADGRPLAFPPQAEGEERFDGNEKLTLFRDARGYALRDAEGLAFRFVNGPPGQVRPLAAVEDRCGNAVRLERDTRGRLARIEDSAGRSLVVESDSQGRITALVVPHPDRAGESYRAVTYGYDGEGDLVEVHDSYGHPIRYAYQGHLLVRETDRAGLSFHFQYDGAAHEARCLRTWGDGGLFARAITYDVQARRTAVTDSRGGVTVHDWNELGLVTRTVDARGHAWLTAWDEHGNRLAHTDPLGNRTEFAYDDAGRVARRVDPAGGSERWEYDAHGDLVRYVDAAGGEWRAEYDARGNLTAAHDPTGFVTRYESDARGLLVRMTDPLGRETHLAWGRHAEMLSWSTPSRSVTRFAYDAHGRPVRCVDALAGELRLEWDLCGRLVRRTDQEGRTFRFSFDGAGNLREMVDPAGSAWTYAWGPLGVPVRAREPDGTVVTFTYDTEGDLEAVRDAAGREWRFWRRHGAVVEEREFTGRRLRYAYDAAGRLRSVENARGEVTRLERDPVGRLVRRVFHDGREETFAYDAAGRVVGARSDAARVEFAYDAAGRRVRESLNGDVVASTYDPVGNRVERAGPLGRALGFAYDSEDRLERLSSPAGVLLELRHDPLGRETRRMHPSGVHSTREYLRSGELVAQRTAAAEGTPLFDRRYRYNGAGQLERAGTRAFGPSRYTHDAAGRLVEAAYPDGRTERFAYDAAGNAAASPLDAGVPRGLRFDAETNLVEKEWNGGRLRLEYDAAGRLASAETPGGERVTFAYDALGRRTRKCGPARVVEYLWDGNQLLGERVWRAVPSADEQGNAPGGPSAAREFVYLPDCGDPVAVLDGTGSFLLEGDHLGTPVLAIALDGRVLLEVDFLAFGQVRERRGAADVPFRFPGQLEDPETGLFYNRFRYYDPGLRIYTQPDPLGIQAGLLPHNYVPSPLLWIDPLGLMGWLFRNVAETVAKAWIQAKLPGRNMTPIGHVLNGSKKTFKGSQYISATKSKAVADKWRKPDEVTIKFDVDDVVPDIKGEMKIIDVSTTEGAKMAGLKGSALNFAVKSEEVLIVGRIPPESVKVCK